MLVDVCGSPCSTTLAIPLCACDLSWVWGCFARQQVPHLLRSHLQVAELEILELVEKMGNPSKDEGEWIAKIDLVENGKALKLEEQEQLGKCGPECKTIQKAVEDILEEHDTDIAEKLWQVRAQFTSNSDKIFVSSCLHMGCL